MSNENGTSPVRFVSAVRARKLSDKDRIAVLEGEVERLGGTLDQALGELRSIRQRLEARRSGDLMKT